MILENFNLVRVLLVFTHTFCYGNEVGQKSTLSTWVAQSVKCPTWAQVMISHFVSLSPMLGSGLMAQSLEPASDSVSPSLSAPSPLVLFLSLKNKYLKKFKNTWQIFHNQDPQNDSVICFLTSITLHLNKQNLKFQGKEKLFL